MPSFTKDAIKKSFIKLLNEKPFNKITVRDIVEDCGINRNSFYYHFDDIPSLLEEILTDEINRVFDDFPTLDSIYDAMMQGMGFAVENKRAVFHIFNSANREMFERYLMKISYQVVSNYAEAVSKEYKLGKEDNDAIVKYYQCLLYGLVMEWLMEGMKYDLSDQLKRMCDIFGNSIETACQKAAGKQIES